jgi:hypothetical protein
MPRSGESGSPPGDLPATQLSDDQRLPCMSIQAVAAHRIRCGRVLSQVAEVLRRDIEDRTAGVSMSALRKEPRLHDGRYSAGRTAPFSFNDGLLRPDAWPQ